MSTVYQEVLSANQAYASTFGDHANLPMPPGRQIAVLTCMDARLDPAQYCGLNLGDAHIIRNAGGRASDDAIRSLVISHKLLGTREWFVIHHSDCGMETFTNETMRELLRDSGNRLGSTEGDFIDWLTIDNQEASVLADVQRIRHHPLVPHDVTIYGFIFDVKSGRLIEVPAASQAGQPG